MSPDGLFTLEREAWRKLAAKAAFAAARPGSFGASRELANQAQRCRKVPIPTQPDGVRDRATVQRFSALIRDGLAWQFLTAAGRIETGAALAALAQACLALLAPAPPPPIYERPPAPPRKDIYG